MVKGPKKASRNILQLDFAFLSQIQNYKKIITFPRRVNVTPLRIRNVVKKLK